MLRLCDWMIWQATPHDSSKSRTWCIESGTQCEHSQSCPWFLFRVWCHGMIIQSKYRDYKELSRSGNIENGTMIDVLFLSFMLVISFRKTQSVPQILEAFLSIYRPTCCLLNSVRHNVIAGFVIPCAHNWFSHVSFLSCLYWNFSRHIRFVISKCPWQENKTDCSPLPEVRTR